MGDYDEKVNPKKIIKGFLILVLALLVCFVVGITGFTIFYLSNTNSKSNYLNVKAVKPAKDGQVNILLAGIDVGANDASSNSTKADNTKKDNSIILLSYDQNNKKLNTIYIPRDTLIKYDSNRRRINYANSIDGPKFLVSSVENMLKIKINYYAGFDYAAFRSIIDSIGGIDISINNDMKYDDEVQKLHINFTSGSTVHMDGQKAEEYYRWVKNNDGKGLLDGDLGRIKNQQIVAATVMKKFTRFSTIMNYPKIIATISKNVETNMSTAEIIGYARDFSKLSKDNIVVETAKGVNVNIDSEKYYLFDSESNMKLLNSSIAANKTAAVDKSTLKVLIWNGTDKNGLAKTYKDKLAKLGYSNITVGNAPKKPVVNTSIIYYNMDENKLLKIQNSLGNTFKSNDIELVTSKSTSKSDVFVTLGNDTSN